MIYFLHSVGTAFEPDTLETFPLKIDGTPSLDWGTAVHLDDLCEEWREALSPGDLALVAPHELRRFPKVIPARDDTGKVARRSK